jgi:ADP-heptose:LPS heptosyltransferase
LDILFITHTRIGDAVMSSGILHHLVERYPHARFTIVCGPLAAPLFAATPRLKRTIVVTKRKFDLHWYELWKELRGTVWDIAVDLRRSLITYVVRVRERHVIGPIAPGVHHVAHLSQLLGLLPPAAPHIYVDAHHQRAAVARIRDGRPVLAIAPIAATQIKTWPAERFAAFARRATLEGPCAGWRVALFGGPGDAACAAAIARDLTDYISVFDEPDLLTVHAALARCGAFIGNDSGLAHLAGASGIPTLALFGPTDPVRYGPWGGAVVRAVSMEALSVDEALAGFRHLMAPR